MQSLDDLTREIDALPTLPEIVTKARTRLEQPDCCFDDVVALLELDPVVAARIVKLASSPAFAGAQRAETLAVAIRRLGIRECHALLLTVGLMTTLPTLPPPHDARVFWTLSLASALVGRLLARELAHGSADRAYLAGLVHLLGEALLAIQFTDRFRTAIDVSRRDRLPLVLSLTEEFGCDHAAVAAVMLRHWDLPADVIDAVQHQLSPQCSRRDPLLAAIVTAGDGACRDCGLGLEDPHYESRSWLRRLPPCFFEAVEAAGHASADALLAELEEPIKEAVRFAHTVF
jgi:HD-like signal output (HDOD) protein